MHSEIVELDRTLRQDLRDGKYKACIGKVENFIEREQQSLTCYPIESLVCILYKEAYACVQIVIKMIIKEPKSHNQRNTASKGINRINILETISNILTLLRRNLKFSYQQISSFVHHKAMISLLNQNYVDPQLSNGLLQQTNAILNQPVDNKSDQFANQQFSQTAARKSIYKISEMTIWLTEIWTLFLNYQVIELDQEDQLDEFVTGRVRQKGQPHNFNNDVLTSKNEKILSNNQRLMEAKTMILEQGMRFVEMCEKQSYLCHKKMTHSIVEIRLRSMVMSSLYRAGQYSRSKLCANTNLIEILKLKLLLNSCDGRKKLTKSSENRFKKKCGKLLYMNTLFLALNHIALNELTNLQTLVTLLDNFDRLSGIRQFLNNHHIIPSISQAISYALQGEKELYKLFVSKFFPAPWVHNLINDGLTQRVLKQHKQTFRSDNITFEECRQPPLRRQQINSTHRVSITPVNSMHSCSGRHEINRPRKSRLSFESANYCSSSPKSSFLSSSKPENITETTKHKRNVKKKYLTGFGIPNGLQPNQLTTATEKLKKQRQKNPTDEFGFEDDIKLVQTVTDQDLLTNHQTKNSPKQTRKIFTKQLSSTKTKQLPSSNPTDLFQQQINKHSHSQLNDNNSGIITAIGKNSLDLNSTLKKREKDLQRLMRKKREEVGKKSWAISNQSTSSQKWLDCLLGQQQLVQTEPSKSVICNLKQTSKKMQKQIQFSTFWQKHLMNHEQKQKTINRMRKKQVTENKNHIMNKFFNVLINNKAQLYINQLSFKLENYLKRQENQQFKSMTTNHQGQEPSQTFNINNTNQNKQNLNSFINKSYCINNVKLSQHPKQIKTKQRVNYCDKIEENQFTRGHSTYRKKKGGTQRNRTVHGTQRSALKHVSKHFNTQTGKKTQRTELTAKKSVAIKNDRDSHTSIILQHKNCLEIFEFIAELSEVPISSSKSWVNSGKSPKSINMQDQQNRRRQLCYKKSAQSIQEIAKKLKLKIHNYK